MDFEKLISFAEQVQETTTKDGVAATKKFYKKPPAPSSRKEEKKAKGIESEAVKAFLEKQKREEDEKAAKEKERKQTALKSQLETNEKTDGDELKEKEAVKFIPSDFATGIRRRVGAPITRPGSKALVTVNPCLVKAPNPCLVKAPNPCLVKDSISDKHADSKKAASSSSGGTSSSKGDGHDKKHRSKHKHKDREKAVIINKALEAIADKHRKDYMSGVKTEGVSVKKKKHITKKGPEKPPLSFEQLLQIAHKKHTVPVDIIPVAKPKKVVEDKRPMTQEEKERHMRRHSNAYQAWLNFGKRPSEEKRTGTPDRKVPKPSEKPPATKTAVLDKTKPNSEVAAGDTKIKRRRRRKPKSASATPGSSYKKWLEAETNRKPSGDVCANEVRLKTETSDRKIPPVATNEQRSDAKSNMNGCNNSSQQSAPKSHKPPVTAVRVSTNNSSQQSVSRTVHKNHDTVAKVSTNNSSQQSVSKSHKPSVPAVRVSTNNSSQQSVSKTVHKNHNTVTKVSTNNSSQQNVSKTGHKPPVTAAKTSNNSSQQSVSNTGHKPPINVARKPTTAPPGCMNGSRPSSGATSNAKKAARGSGHYISTRETVLKCGSPAIKANSVAEKTKPVTSWDRIYGEIQKNNPQPVRRKRHIEEEAEEEDSEEDEDDFIADDDDDATGGGVDYSKYIKDIFGYDKTRFRNERQDDLRDMESSYSQVTKEERISARLGLREDLDDIRQEEEKNKRKMMRAKHR